MVAGAILNMTKAEAEWTRELGRRIAAARWLAGYDQSEIGAALGLTRGAMSNVENGRQRVAAYRVAQIADLCNTTVEALLPPLSEEDRL